MPCRQADCLRGCRKRGEGGKGMGAEGERVCVYRVKPSTPPNPKSLMETTLIPPSPCSPHPSPSRRVFVFLLVLICPSAPCPASPQSPSHYLPPVLSPSTPFYKGFIMSKTANFSLVCERRNVLHSPPTLFILSPTWIPPPPSSLPSGR